jgi:hypothetical protein
MKNWGVIVAALILAAAIVFYGLCGRYVVVDNSSTRHSFKVDRLTGQVRLIAYTHQETQYKEFDIKQR